MITAIVLARLGINVINSVIEQLEQIEEIKSIMSVTGVYDLIIEIEVETPERLYEVFANRIDSIAGIIESNTHVVMKSWEK
jgi:DNA-binding Lrp family transcriptional regulator